jgi:hypothetical protein
MRLVVEEGKPIAEVAQDAELTETAFRPRIHAELRAQRWRAAQKRVAHLIGNRAVALILSTLGGNSALAQQPISA